MSKEKDSEDIVEIVFHPNADYSLKKEEFSDGVCSEEETKKEANAIVLDSDDDQASKLPNNNNGTSMPM